jgi:hypothetical protein
MFLGSKVRSVRGASPSSGELKMETEPEDRDRNQQSKPWFKIMKQNDSLKV